MHKSAMNTILTMDSMAHVKMCELCGKKPIEFECKSSTCAMKMCMSCAGVHHDILFSSSVRMLCLKCVEKKRASIARHFTPAGGGGVGRKQDMLTTHMRRRGVAPLLPHHRNMSAPPVAHTSLRRVPLIVELRRRDMLTTQMHHVPLAVLPMPWQMHRRGRSVLSFAHTSLRYTMLVHFS